MKSVQADMELIFGPKGTSNLSPIKARTHNRALLTKAQNSRRSNSGFAVLGLAFVLATAGATYLIVDVLPSSQTRQSEASLVVELDRPERFSPLPTTLAETHLPKAVIAIHHSAGRRYKRHESTSGSVVNEAENIKLSTPRRIESNASDVDRLQREYSEEAVITRRLNIQEFRSHTKPPGRLLPAN